MGVHAPAPAIRPSEPAISILTSARRLTGVDWRTGISARAAACQRAHTWPECPALTDRKCEPDTQGPVEWDPFWMYVPGRCEWVSDPLGFAAEQGELLTAATASQVARFLWTGEVDTNPVPTVTTNPSLMNCATDISATSAVDPVTAFATLLANYEQCTNTAGSPTFHVPSVLIPWLMNAYLIRQEGNVYRGPSGALVSPGPNYPTDGPFGPGGAVAASGEAWMYITGTVEYALGDVVLLPEDEKARFLSGNRQNAYEVWAEREALVRFDCCCVFAVLTRQPSPS